MIKWISLALAVIGVTVALVAALTTTAEAPEPPLASRPSIDPYRRSVAAVGIVEGRTRNVRVAPTEPGFVREVLVEVNNRVESGDPLFRLDARTLKAELVEAQAAVSVAERRLSRSEALPRAEDVPIARAEVARLRAQSEDAQDAYESILGAVGREAASEREVTRRKFEAQAAESALDRAEAELDLLLDGAWEADLSLRRAEVRRAEARVESIERRIERLTVRAPIDGTVLKRNIEPGEFAVRAPDSPSIVLADLSTLVVRAQVNEDDIVTRDRMAEAIARPPRRPDRAHPDDVPARRAIRDPEGVAHRRALRARGHARDRDPLRDRRREGIGDLPGTARGRLYQAQRGCRDRRDRKREGLTRSGAACVRVFLYHVRHAL